MLLKEILIFENFSHVMAFIWQKVRFGQNFQNSKCLLVESGAKNSKKNKNSKYETCEFF